MLKSPQRHPGIQQIYQKKLTLPSEGGGNSPQPTAVHLEAKRQQQHELSFNKLREKVEEYQGIIKRRDFAIEELNKRLVVMQEDFQYNLQVLKSRDDEIRLYSEERDQLHTQVNILEGKLEAQRAALNDAETREDQTTEHLKDHCEAQAAQITVLRNERAAALRSAQESEMQSAQLKDELQRLRSKYASEFETEKHRILEETEKQIAEKDRTVRSREESVHAEAKRLEHQVGELTNDLNRLRDSSLQAEAKANELQSTVSRKESMLASLHQQLHDERRSHSHTVTELENEVARLRATLQQEKAITLTTTGVARELEKKTQALELTEERLQGLKTQQDVEQKKWHAQCDSIEQELQEKIRLQAEKLRQAENKAAELYDTNERQRRQITELKREREALESDMVLTAQKAEEFTRIEHGKDHKVEKLESEIRRLQDTLSVVEKEAQMLRDEFKRREDEEKLVEQHSLKSRVERWKKTHELSATGDSGVLTGDTQLPPPLLNNSGRPHHFGGGSRTMIGGATPIQYEYHPSYYQRNTTAAGADVTVELLNDIKDQLKQQPQPAPLPEDPRFVQVKHEMALLRETTLHDKLELEKRLSDTTRKLSREKNKVDQMQSYLRQQQTIDAFDGGNNLQYQAGLNASNISGAAPQNWENSLSSPQKELDYSSLERKTTAKPTKVSVRSTSPSMEKMKEMRRQLSQPIEISTPPKRSPQRTPEAH